MDDLLSRVVIDLQEKYKPHTIILYGSRAREDCTPSSDIDVVCFVEGATPIQDAREFEGFYLDAWVYGSDAMSASSDELLRVSDGYCLYDSQGHGEAFLKQLQQRIEQGRKPLSSSERQHTKLWVDKMLERAKTSDVESLYRRYWLAVDLLQIYFDLRRQWYLGPKKSLIWLREHDSIGYHLFSQVYERGIRFDDLGKLSEYVTNT
ncbi:nucleotidyltransferase domain-containing protein [Brasilonema sp. UFV-L1]|uniref:nucleotidyltransferase family protein n=1 Tax=Brasilonema sp. UFV-L1 TaxID=2234130 RepID=UPI00145DC534|nr:nucleotidyltransferase domain-containing protein [Brasilonema sp. UFV-L1]NMG07947.1 nucleotidyltransferase domain-containing protein [Brasilonema sp. UFV-L1]